MTADLGCGGGRQIGAEFWLALRRQKRQLFEFLLGTGLLLVVFMLLVLGVSVGDHIAGLPSREQLAVGFVAWRFAAAAYGGVAVEVADDIRAHCLEQLAIGGRLQRIYSTRVVVNLLFAISSSAAMILVLFAILGSPITFSLIDLYLLLILGAPAIAGLGFIVAAFNVALKQAETINALMLMSVVALSTLPGYPFSNVSYLPFVYAASLSRELAVGGSPSLADLAVVLLTSGVYLAFGLSVFCFAVRFARVRGTLSHY